jgi:Protein of unknown function (DUF1631)
VLLSRATLSEDSRALIQRLDGPACRIAVEEPQVWQSPDHPLWLLLDRLVSAATVHDTLQAPGPGDGASADTVGATLERVVRELETSSSPGSAHCQSALTAVDFAVSGLLGEQAARVAPQAQALQQRQSRAAMEPRMREQIEQQVQGSGAPPILRRFLVGPWALALAHSACAHGVDSRQVRGQAELVDELIGACSRPPGGRLSWTLFTRCVTHARLGLEDAGFDAAHVQTELADLEQVLRDPWTAREAAAADGPALAQAPADRPEASAEVLSSLAETVPSALLAPLAPTARLGLHDALPTVPIDMDDAAGAGPSGGGPDRAAAWLQGLEPGQVCRLFLLERWMNAHLVWRSANHSMFIFNSRHGGRTHSLSRRSLEKLRAAGLATTIERGEFVAQAMRELAGRSRAAQPG